MTLNLVFLKVKKRLETFIPRKIIIYTRRTAQRAVIGLIK